MPLDWNDYNAERIRQFVGETFDYPNIGRALKADMIAYLTQRQIEPKDLLQQQTNTGASLPKLDIKKQDDHESIEEFINRLDALFDIAGTHQAHRLPQLISAASPKVGAIIADFYKIGLVNYQDVRAELLKQYGLTTWDKWQKFASTKRGQRETWIQFGRRLRRLLEVALNVNETTSPDGTVVIEKWLQFIITDNMVQPLRGHICEILESDNRPTWIEVLERADKFEATHKDPNVRRNLTSQDKSQSKKQDQSKQPTCFYCHVIGHVAPDCPQKPKRQGNGQGSV